MTEQSFPIAPTPELVKEWFLNAKEACPDKSIAGVAVQAARWGADQELEECVEWLLKHGYDLATQELHYARRPKPQSLKEQALELVNEMNTGGAGWLVVYDKDGVIRRALEQLDD